MNSLQNFDYNGQLIQRRADGYVNLTQMCQANGKRLNDFLDSRRALSVIFVLYSIQKGQILHPVQVVGEDTWGHFSLASELAYQSDAPFSVWFNLTFYGTDFPINKCFDVDAYKQWQEETSPWRNDPSNEKEKQGTVYFILNESRNLLKVGFTGGKTCDSRLSAFKSGAVGDSFIVLKEIPGTLKMEAMFHSFLAEYRFKGEWFHYTDDVKKFLDSVGNRQLNIGE